MSETKPKISINVAFLVNHGNEDVELLPELDGERGEGLHGGGTQLRTLVYAPIKQEYILSKETLYSLYLPTRIPPPPPQNITTFLLNSPLIK